MKLLGEIGTVGSVEVLLLPTLPRGPADNAIAAIQLRLGGVERGGLALAVSEGGELSEAAQAGTVAVVPDKT